MHSPHFAHTPITRVLQYTAFAPQIYNKWVGKCASGVTRPNQRGHFGVVMIVITPIITRTQSVRLINNRKMTSITKLPSFSISYCCLVLLPFYCALYVQNTQRMLATITLYMRRTLKLHSLTAKNNYNINSGTGSMPLLKGECTLEIYFGSGFRT